MPKHPPLLKRVCIFCGMADLADAFVALPGGYGTLQELFEVMIWSQLGIHAKPCALLNIKGYFDPLLAMSERAIAAERARSAPRFIVGGR